MTDAMPSARDIAVEALRDRSGNVTAHLNRALERDGIAGQDASFARELALGAIRRRGTLKAVLGAFLQQPNRPLPGALREILYVALYQVLFLDRVPEFAAVDEAVRQASTDKRPKHGGLVNGILRTVLRELSPVEAGPVPHAVDAIPVGPNAMRRVKRAVFTDPQEVAAKYLAQAYSLPEPLAARWIRQSGSLDGAAAVATHANCRAPLILRVNTLRATVETVLASLAEAGVEAGPHANGVSVVLGHQGKVTGLDVFRDGWVQPQDATATGVGLAAAPQAGMRVLDFCAAPGTKTTHLAEQMDNRGEIVAIDISDEKLGRVQDNCSRLGVEIVRTLRAEQAGSLDPESFDLVLADVPCSNTGVLARRAEARWRFSEKAMARVTKDQRMLAVAAAQFVKPGGRLVYSTCSIEPEECGQVVAHLATAGIPVTLEREELTLPGGADAPAEWHDGGYVAIIRKS
jgi:16S rRNA (cytosine967-C5)-methyltransferase